MATTHINKNSLGSSNFLKCPEDPVLAGLRSAKEAEHGAAWSTGCWSPGVLGPFWELEKISDPLSRKTCGFA